MFSKLFKILLSLRFNAALPTFNPITVEAVSEEHHWFDHWGRKKVWWFQIEATQWLEKCCHTNFDMQLGDNQHGVPPPSPDSSGHLAPFSYWLFSSKILRQNSMKNFSGYSQSPVLIQYFIHFLHGVMCFWLRLTFRVVVVIVRLLTFPEPLVPHQVWLCFISLSP